MAKQFSRHIDSELIKELRASDLWVQVLEPDCKKRDVFLAIRPGYISFYHKGGGIFHFDKKGFKTNISYSVVLNKTNIKDDYIYEGYLPNAKLIDNFIDGYIGIKENCKRYSKETEAEGVSEIYHKYPYNSQKSDVVVLDIEVALIDDTLKKGNKGKQNRIDILLFNKGKKELRFIEAKLFDNDEIRAKKSSPPVINQLGRYRDMIVQKNNDILSAYQEYTDTLNTIFNGLALPKPQKIDANVGLLIFDFDKDQREGRLKDQIKKNQEFAGIPVYPIGNIEDINAENLWKGTE